MYTVCNSLGEVLLQSERNCRYRPQKELSLMQAGYTIRLDGKRITKKEAIQHAESDQRYGADRARS